MASVNDMTKGSPIRLIITFALPLLLGNACQQLYSVVDTAVVGKVLGVTALAAVGAAAWLDWLVLGFMIGLTTGFSILISQRFGAGDMQGLRRAVAMSALLALGAVTVITILSASLCGTVLTLMRTPAEALPLSVAYTRILFMGLPVSLCYNLFSAILRALGNSRMPLVAMIIASCVNIALDILFVAGFGWGVQGAAIATVTGQGCAALFCLFPLSRISIIRPKRADWRPHGETIRALTRLALPIAGQNTVVAFGGVALQSIANTFGVNFVAGYSAAAKIQGLLEMAGISFGTTMATYSGQNLGAGRVDRIRAGVRQAIAAAAVCAVFCGTVGLLFGRQMALLFVTAEGQTLEEVLTAVTLFLRPYCLFLTLLFSLFILRCTLQGMGDTVFPIVSAFLQVFMRSVLAFILARTIGAFGVCVADVSAWASACVMLYFVYRRRIDRLDPAGKRAFL